MKLELQPLPLPHLRTEITIFSQLYIPFLCMFPMYL